MVKFLNVPVKQADGVVPFVVVVSSGTRSKVIQCVGGVMKAATRAEASIDVTSPTEDSATLQLSDVHVTTVVQEGKTSYVQEEVYGTPGTSQSNVHLDGPKLPQCVVCLSDVARVIVLPCRHQCMCLDCFKSMDGEDVLVRVHQCPICRVNVRAWVETLQDLTARSVQVKDMFAANLRSSTGQSRMQTEMLQADVTLVDEPVTLLQTAVESVDERPLAQELDSLAAMVGMDDDAS